MTRAIGKLAWLVILGLAFGVGAPAGELPAESPLPVTIAVAAGERQSFGGFGASLGNWHGEYQQLAPAERARLSDFLWRDLRFHTLRLWMNLRDYAPTPGAHDLTSFRRCYVDSGIIDDARRRGVTKLLLAPDGLPDYLAEKQADGGRGMKEDGVGRYAEIVAEFIQRLQAETGVAIDVTGLQNEPNVDDRFTAAEIVETAKKLRQALDRWGLGEVRIVAPENASCDGSFYASLDALKQDETAWKALAGIASHSYNMAATEEAARRIAGPDGRNTKEYWMTEASDNGPEEPGDSRRAASLAARFLNDMNHRVTDWIHFLGFEVADPRDNATRIMAYSGSPFHLVRFQKYFMYRQLAAAFEVGARLRVSTSSLEGGMTWTYGQKPRLTAAAARNPDGTWAVGLANDTADSFLGVQGWANDDWNRRQGGHTPGQTFTVTIRIEELKDAGELPCAVERTGGAAAAAEGEKVIFRGGETHVTVAPLEVVTLRSVLPPAGK